MNGLDYKDLIANAYRLLQNEDIRRIWHDKYRYIMIDEMQDTSIFEYTMLHYLFPARNVMLCGDEFQTIYEWRGSNPERILKDFRENTIRSSSTSRKITVRPNCCWKWRIILC